MLSVFLPLEAAVTRRRRMWPEPSVSGLISRPLPGSPDRPTFQHRALPREGLAEEENHFSRLARPGRAFLPRPCPSAVTGNGAGAQHAQRSPPQGTQAPDPGTPACLGAPTGKSSGSKVSRFRGGQGLQTS